MITTRDDARQRITIRAVGPVSLQDLLSAVQQQHADGTWHHAVLYDMRGVMMTAVSSEMRPLANHISGMDTSLRGPVAVVATDVRLYGMACTYAALIQRRGQRFQVFHDLPEAESWLESQTLPPQPPT